MSRAGVLPTGQNQHIDRLHFAILLVATDIVFMRLTDDLSGFCVAFDQFLGKCDEGLRTFA
jgi:hypothetical protein